MTGPLERLNLRPQERRLVVAVAVVFFVVLNLWFVRPHLHDWSQANADLEKAKATLATFERETKPAKIAENQTRLKELEGQGSAVAPSEQSLDLIRSIQTQAAQSGVAINANTEVQTSTSARTNAFFEEKARLINVVTGEKELVDFLVSLASTNSMIRVRSMNLRPDSSQMRLQGTITLVASYQRSQPKKAATAAQAKKSEGAAKPGAATPALAPPGGRNTNAAKLPPRETPKPTVTPKPPESPKTK
jgi:Tfp pilus assembly protein PilO